MDMQTMQRNGQGTVDGKRKRGRQRKRQRDNNYRGMDREQWRGRERGRQTIIIEEWTGNSGGEEKEADNNYRGIDRETIGRDPATGTQPQQMEETGAQLVRTASRRLHGELSEQGNVKWPACRCLQTHLRQSTLSFDLRHVPQKELCTNLNSLLRLKPTTHHPPPLPNHSLAHSAIQTRSRYVFPEYFPSVEFFTFFEPLGMISIFRPGNYYYRSGIVFAKIHSRIVNLPRQSASRAQNPVLKGNAQKSIEGRVQKALVRREKLVSSQSLAPSARQNSSPRAAMFSLHLKCFASLSLSPAFSPANCCLLLRRCGLNIAMKSSSRACSYGSASSEITTNVV